MPLAELFTLCLKYNKKRVHDARSESKPSSSDNDKFTTVKLERLNIRQNFC